MITIIKIRLQIHKCCMMNDDLHWEIKRACRSIIIINSPTSWKQDSNMYVLLNLIPINVSSLPVLDFIKCAIIGSLCITVAYALFVINPLQQIIDDVSISLLILLVDLPLIPAQPQ